MCAAITSYCVDKLERRAEMKRRVWISIAVVLVFMLSCTLISFKNYTSGLNRVTVAATAPNQIRRSISVNGMLRFAESETIALPEGCKTELLVKKGENLSEGAPLCQVDTDDLQLTYYETLVQQQALDAQASGDAAGQLARLKAERCAEKAAELKALLDNGGLITAPFTGQVTSISVNALTLGDLSGDGYFEWTLPLEQMDDFSLIGITAAGFSQSVNIETPLYDEVRRCYSFKSELVPLSKLSEPMDGMRAAIKLQVISDEYPAVLPKSCIQHGSDGGSYVFLLREKETVLGTEYYLQQTGVTIIDEDDLNAAVLASLKDLVIASTRPMKDLETVLVVE